jgi:3-oxoacyl-[acyl-carrier protein] reductase
MNKLVGKRALVTGAGHGIGAGIASALLEAGCDVAVHHRGERLSDLDAVAKAHGRRIFYHQADLTRTSEAQRCVADAVADLGGLEILINNAGGLVGRRALEDVDDAFWQQVIDINMTTMLTTTRAAIPALARANGASIVNVSSLAGRKGGHGGSLVYATTKGAVLTWTRALSSELGARGIRVNAVAPGLILGTKFHDTFTTPEAATAIVAGIPLGRGGTVEDVARAVVFLAAEFDGFITGATLDINGGVYCA